MIQPQSTDLCIGWYGPVGGIWMSLLDHFEQVELLDRHSASEWLDDATSDRKLLIGLEHRSDPKLGWLLDLASKTSKPPVKQSSSKATKKRSTARKAPEDGGAPRKMACVLGEDWGGHRRTFPLPESIETFYWHQWYDQVLPWVGLGPTCYEMSSTGLRVGRIATDSDRFLSWRASKETHATLSNRIAWVISDQESQVQLWHELLESYGIRAVGSRADRLQAVIEADLMVVDIHTRNGNEFICGELGRKEMDFLSQLREGQPRAFMVVTDGFVQMERWKAYRGLGIDAVVGRPWNLQGVLYSWERWLAFEHQPELAVGRTKKR